MPTESSYADDVEFYEEKIEDLEKDFNTTKKILVNFNLYLNETKTEKVKIYLANPTEIDENGESLAGKEKWRTSKCLGSLLCSDEDIKNRIIVGNIAFNSYKKLWARRKITMKKQVHLYDALMTSVMLYRSISWATTKKALQK